MWTLPGKKQAPEIRSYKKDKVFFPMASWRSKGRKSGERHVGASDWRKLPKKLKSYITGHDLLRQIWNQLSLVTNGWAF